MDKKNNFLTKLDENPIIAAVKDMKGLEIALQTDCRVIFLLFGSLVTISELSAMVKAADKMCMIHIDLMDGLAMRDVSVDFVAKNTSADGIISTKLSLVKHADASGLLAIQRFFMLDSMALSNLEKQYPKDSACAIEILPGLMPKIIRQLTGMVEKPIIAGGLISEKEDAVNALKAGARAVSSTNPEVWRL